MKERSKKVSEQLRLGGGSYFIPSTSITSTTDSDATNDIPVASQYNDIVIEVDSFVFIAFEPEGKGQNYYYVGEIRRQGKRNSYKMYMCKSVC